MTRMGGNPSSSYPCNPCNPWSISKSVAVVLVNPVVRPDVEQMDFHSGTFPRSNKFKNDAEIVTNRARPAPLEITGKIVGPQRGMVWLSFKRLERCLRRSRASGLCRASFFTERVNLADQTSFIRREAH